MQTFDHAEREVVVAEKFALKKNDVTPEVMIYEKFTPDFRARLATQLVERWGLIAADVQEEENSAGRNKVRLMAPNEIVARACDTADLLVSELHKRGWMTETPSYSDAVQMLKETADADA